jgi:hypothetical protein
VYWNVIQYQNDLLGYIGFFLLLKLFSLAIECQERKLYGLFPLAAGVVREFD